MHRFTKISTVTMHSTSVNGLHDGCYNLYVYVRRVSLVDSNTRSSSVHELQAQYMYLVTPF